MKLSVGLKLYVGFGLMLAALVVTGVFAITQLGSVGSKGKSIFDDGLEQTQKSAGLRRDAATREVSAGAEQMTAQVEQVTAAAHALGQIADGLLAKVATFKLAQDAGKQPISLRQAMDTESNAA